MREMAPIGEMAPGCAKKYKKKIFKNPFAPGAISRMITVIPCMSVQYSLSNLFSANNFRNTTNCKTS